MNKVFEIGRLVRDCEMRSTQSGISVCNFTIAVDRRTKKDEPKEADFLPCTAWRERGEFINKYFHKGDPISIVGQMRTDKYQDKDGNNRTKIYIEVDEAEFVPGKKSDTAQATQPAQAAPDNGGMVQVEGEELPF